MNSSRLLIIKAEKSVSEFAYILGVSLLGNKFSFTSAFISKKEFDDTNFDYESAIIQNATLKSEISSLDAVINSRKAQIEIIKAELEEV